MSVNKVILIGRVGKDPDIKHFEAGQSVASFPLAMTERGYTTQNGTQVPERTEWVTVVCWRGLAKIAEQYIKKGSQIYLEGKIRTRSYDDANNAKRYVMEVYANNLELLENKQQSNNPPMQTVPRQERQEDTDDLPF